MTFVPRRLAALAVLIAVTASLALAGAAIAATSTITQQDCAQGTIRDKSGNAISKERCQQLIGKNVELASTGLDVRPFVAGGVLLLLGGAALTLRRRGAPQLG